VLVVNATKVLGEKEDRVPNNKQIHDDLSAFYDKEIPLITLN
jgi:hypothetical protein